MNELIRELLAWVPTYPELFVMCVLMGIIGLVPEDVVVMLAGMKTLSGQLELIPTVAVVCVGILFRDLLAYTVGHAAGDWLLSRPLVVKLIGQSKIDRARAMFSSRGAQAVILGRFMVGMRVAVFIVAGSLRVERRPFIFWDFLGVLITVPLEMWLGARFGQPIIYSAARVLSRTSSVIGALAVVGVGLGIWFGVRKARESGNDEAEPPAQGEGDTTSE